MRLANGDSVDWKKFLAALGATVYFLYYAATASTTSWHFIDNINLIIHEAGHFIFTIGGQFIYIIGGSFSQIFVPCLFVYYFFKTDQSWAGGITLFWVGQNLINVSVYMGDAIAMSMPLIGGDTHDWNYIFSNLGVLNYSQNIGSAVFGLGIFIICVAAVLSLKGSFRRYY